MFFEVLEISQRPSRAQRWGGECDYGSPQVHPTSTIARFLYSLLHHSSHEVSFERKKKLKIFLKTSLNYRKGKELTEYIKSYADVICLRNTVVYCLTDRLNQLISEMEHRGRKRNKTVIQLQLVVGLLCWPDSLKDSPFQLNNLQTHRMHLPS